MDILTSILGLVKSHQIITSGAVISIVVFVAGWLLKRWEWLVIWRRFELLGAALDKIIVLKCSMIEKITDDVGVRGFVPAAVASVYGMVKNNAVLVKSLRDMLVEMAALIDSKTKQI